MQERSGPLNPVDPHIVIKPSTAEVHGPMDLEAEWQRQGSILASLGFHEELRLTAETYVATLPKFEPQPEEYRSVFDVPLLVETRIPWEKQAYLAGIQVSETLESRLSEIKPWKDNNSQTPKEPYTGWFNSWGQRLTEPVAPLVARTQLQSGEVAGGLLEAIDMQLAHPEYNNNDKYFDLIGDSIGFTDVPFLYRAFGKPRFGAGRGDEARPRCLPLIRGSKIVLGDLDQGQHFAFAVPKVLC